MRIQNKKARAMVYKILTGTLYMGRVARNHLRYRPVIGPHVLEAYNQCLACGRDGCEPQHRFFECATVQPLWDKVRRIFHAVGLQNPVRTWLDLPLLLANPKGGAFRTLGGIVTVEIVTYALFAVWIEYNEEVRLVKDATDPANPHRESALRNLRRAAEEFSSPSEVRVMDAFNGLLSRSIYMLPHHERAIDNDLAFDYGVDRVKRAPLLRQQNLLPRLVVDFSALNPDQQELYNNFWARGNVVATVAGGSLVVNLRDMDRLFDFLHR
jgi:hypothetical protein